MLDIVRRMAYTLATLFVTLSLVLRVSPEVTASHIMMKLSALSLLIALIWFFLAIIVSRISKEGK